MENTIHSQAGIDDYQIEASHLSKQPLGYMLTMNDSELLEEHENAIGFYGSNHPYTIELAETIKERILS